MQPAKNTRTAADRAAARQAVFDEHRPAIEALKTAYFDSIGRQLAAADPRLTVDVLVREFAGLWNVPAEFR